MNDSPISVVVIGRNEGSRLTACLQSVRSARGVPPTAQLIYVDSNSTDDSLERAATFGAEVIVVGPGKMSAARARNAGWRAAHSLLILFLDGDTLLHPDFVATAMPHFEKSRVAVVWGHRREANPEGSIYNRILDLDWIYAPGLTAFCGGDALMRRSALEQADGFNADLIAGEEPDLCRRMRAKGHLVLHIDAPMTRHDLAISRFSQYWRRAVRSGFAYAEIGDRYANTPDPLWSAESRGNLLRGSLYAGAVLALVLATAWSGSWIPLAVGVLGGFAVAARTAIACRWKGASWSTLFLYGMHSHLQHVCMLQGQLLYKSQSWRRQQSRLIEYKTRS